MISTGGATRTTCLMDVPLVLERFTATNSAQDQDDLSALYRHDKRKPLSGPLLLGKRKQPDGEAGNTIKTSDVFAVWSESLILNSISHFPTSVKLKARKRIKLYLEEDVQILDPRFVLTQLWHLLSSRNLVDCRHFIDKNGLSLILVALSSRQSCVRKIAYSALQRFYRQIESQTFATFKDRHFWLNFIDSLRCGLKEENEQLRRLRTSFLTNSIRILRQPLHVLFPQIRDLVLNHSNSDSELASEVLKLMQSAHPASHKQAFEWALAVITQAMDQKEDFELLNECRVFDFLIESGSSPLFSPIEHQLVLTAFEATSRIEGTFPVLCKNNALIVFLNDKTFERELDKASVVTISSIACNIAKHYCTDSGDGTFLRDFCQLLLSLTRHVSKLDASRKTVIQKFNDIVFQTLECVKKKRSVADFLQVCNQDIHHLKKIQKLIHD